MRVLWVLLAKDLRHEVRTWETAVGVLSMALMINLILGFALPSGTSAEGEGGLLWVAILFPALLIHGRLWNGEAGSLDGLLTAPVAPALLWGAKFLLALLFTGLLALMMIPVYLVLLNAVVRGPALPFLASVALGIVGLSAAGTSLSALTARLRHRDLLLPIMLLPLVVPLFLGCVVMAGWAFAGGAPPADNWLLLLGVFDAVYLLLPLLLADILMEG